jgi:hypothetical protein
VTNIERCGACQGAAHATPEQSQACRQLFWLANMEINLAQAAAAAVSPKEQ